MEKFGVISTPVPGGEMKMNLVEIITLKDDDSPAVRSQKSALNMAKMVAAGMLKDQTNGFLGCNGVPVLMDAFAMFEIEDPAAMKRRKKKEKAARQKAGKEAIRVQTANEQKKSLSSLINTILRRATLPEREMALENMRQSLVVSIIGEMDHGPLQTNAGGELEVDHQRLKIPAPAAAVDRLMKLVMLLRKDGLDAKDSRYGAFIRYLMTGNAAKECFTCGKPAIGKHCTCRGCHVASFCDRECQRKGWQAHAAHCKLCKESLSV